MIQFESKFRDLPLTFNPDEIDEAAWISLEALRDTLIKTKYSYIPGYHICEESKSQFDQPPGEINTRVLYPLYRFNPFKQGLGKGHYLALRYLLRQHQMI